MGRSSATSRHESGIIPPVNSRAPSCSSVLAHIPYDHLDGVSGEDMTVAEGLLARNVPRIPPRRSSFDRSSSSMKPTVLAGNHAPDHANRRSRYSSTSNTWTSSNCEVSETDEIDDRTTFVQEYNKVASQCGVSELHPDNYEAINSRKVTSIGKQGNWFMGKILRRTSSMLSVNKSKSDLKHKRSISDFSLRMAAAKKGSFKDKHLAELVRLCGSSPFYLPTEYAAGTLSLPTCFRATAQYLVQRGPTIKGIFRIPGSHAIVSALYDHYASQDEDGDVISGTVRCPTLPDSILCDEHDVASAFKKFLSGLPGGILGKVWLFEGLVSIHNKMGIDLEWARTKRSRVRARLIACAIFAHPSQFQRDLICAVFGLLSMIGRTAENALREDEHGRPLPTHGLMGYSPLGTIFGPLLMGELIEEYNPRLGEPNADSSPAKVPAKRKSKHKKTKSVDESLQESKSASEKLKIENRVTEMLITHWRDVVRHMKNLNSMTSPAVQRHLEQETSRNKAALLRPSASESFFLQRPPNWEPIEQFTCFNGRGRSPTLPSRNPLKACEVQAHHPLSKKSPDAHSIKRQKSRSKATSSQMLSGARSMSVLTPPKEYSVETQYGHLDSTCDALKAKTRTVPSRPVGKPISGECPLHQNLMPSLQATSEESEFVNETFAGPYPSDRDGYLLKGKIPNKSQEKQQPILVELLADNLAMETKLANPVVKHPQDKTFWEDKAAITTKDSHDISSYTVHKGMEKDRPPLIRRLTGQSPSEHLERMLSTHITQEDLARKPLGVGHRATDPGHLASASLKTSEEYPWQSIGSGIVTSQSQSPFTKDALKRVSQEEDVASLASLAQVLLSQSNNELKFATASDIDAEPSTEVDVANNMLDEKGAAKALIPHIARLEKINTAIVENFTVEPLYHKSRTLGRATETTDCPSTPKRPMTPDPSITPKERMGSVKSLAAKFNSAVRGTDTISSSSPTSSPILGRGKLGLQAQNSMLSNYTTNASPISPARNSSKSRRSFATVRNRHTPDKMAKMAVSPMQPLVYFDLDVSYPKSASLTNGSPRTETPSRWRTLRQGKKYQVDTDSCSTMNCTNNMFQILPSFQRSGDGNGSSDVTRHPSIGTVLPIAAEPAVAQHLNLTRPPSTSHRNVPRSSNGLRSSNGSSLTSPQPFGPLLNPAPSGSPFGIGFHGRGTSMLYSQITNLQKLLEARTEEVDHLRRQLATKDSLNDLGTLTEQLREEKRETVTWRKRAEMAEKRLERLSQLTSMVKSDDTSEEPMLLGPDAPDASRREVNEMNTRAEQGFQAIIRAVLPGGTDGAVGSEESAGSHGTIRRIIPKYRQMSEDDLILFLDTDELLPAVLKPTSTDVVGLCELP